MASSSKAVTVFPFNMRFAKVNNWDPEQQQPVAAGDANAFGFDAVEGQQAEDYEYQPEQQPAAQYSNPFGDDEEEGSLKNPF